MSLYEYIVLFKTPSSVKSSIDILRGKKVTTNFNNDAPSVSGSLDFFLPGQSEDPTTDVKKKKLLCSHDVAGVTDSKNYSQNVLIKNRLYLRTLPQKLDSRSHCNRKLDSYNH